jgi:phosphoribosylaminoimidazole carboxylase (NCAIR synthetase)
MGILKEMTMTVPIGGCERCGKWHETKDHNAVEFAIKMQGVGLEKSMLAYINEICEVCNEGHRTYNCCEKCDYDRHICHFCGDPLGHDEISACYILDMMGIE